MRTLMTLAAIFCCAVGARADWATISTEELLKHTDFVVVARLTKIHEFTQGEYDYGSGILTVSEVLRGEVKAGQRLMLEWRNVSMIACPRVENGPHVGKPRLWLLHRSRSGGVMASYPGRVIRLEERAGLEALLK